ncbi:MAG: ASKHA domain-containing protein, partial [Synergistota bacterium]|nr:ASKHA domain-containing protein [Synergistota bacterium]
SALAEGAGLDMSGCDTMVVAGNSVMELLFMGVSPASLGSSPFTLPIRSFEPRPAGELGLAPVPDETPVHALPLMDAFVGGDTAAVIYEVTEEAILRGEEHLTRLVMDLGTNGEIALLHRGEATVCSTAAGPAFEGVGIKCGMPAVAGAVSAMISDGGSLYCRTVGGAPARGLCGSGLVDVVALLLREGVLTEDGAMDGRAPSFLAGRIEGSGRDRRFVLCESAAGAVAVWQSDVRKFQLAKGALQAGVDLLLAHCGLTARDVDECVLAGAFGSAIRHDSLVEIGLLPAALSGRVRSIGNGAGLGAVRILRDGEEGRARVERLAREARHIRLETAPGFQELFLESLRLSPNQAEIPRQKPASG